MGSVRGFANDMAALDLKEAAQRLQMHGNFAQALPLMLESVAMREYNHTLCLSLSELAELYLDMLKLDEAQETCCRMMREAHRYDEDQQISVCVWFSMRPPMRRNTSIRHWCWLLGKSS